MRLPRKVMIQEVCLRDGLQNEPLIVSTAEKIRLAEKLISCGIKRIELSSFVNPRLVPQMADASDLWKYAQKKEGVLFTALILNDRGLDRAIEAGVRHLGIYVSASETHSLKNSNMKVSKALEEASHLVRKARAAGITVRVGVMNAFGCAYEGEIEPQDVLRIISALMLQDPHEICLADSSGLANPRQIRDLTSSVREMASGKDISLHLHNTRGLGPANFYAALEEGVTIFEYIPWRIGGCPFITGAKGEYLNRGQCLHAQRDGHPDRE